MTIRRSFWCVAACAMVCAAALAVAIHAPDFAAHPAALGAAALVGGLLIHVLLGRPSNAPLMTLRSQTAAAVRGDVSRPVAVPRADGLAELAADINRLIIRGRNATKEVADLKAKIREVQNELEGERSRMEEQVTKRSRDLQVKTEIAARDALTSLINRREGIERLNHLWQTDRIHGQPLACIMLDIDHFKSINDTYGHPAGDHVLREVAAALKANVRQADVVCRVGGEEFLVLCPQGRLDGAAACAEHLRQAVQRHGYQYDGVSLHITISLGVAERSEAMQAPEELLNLTDQCLYHAKRTGRNRVITARQLPAAGPAEPGGPPSGNFRGDALHAPQTEPPRILVAAAAVDARERWTQALRDGGMQVVAVADADGVVSAGREQRCDALILDAGLSGLSGLERIRRLKNEPALADVPTLLIATDNSGPAAQDAFKTGADDLLAEPVAPALLALRAASLARVHRAHLAQNEQRAARDARERTFARLYAFLRSVSRCTTLEDVLDQTLAVAAELTHCAAACVLTPDSAHEQLVVARAVGIDATAVAGLRVPIGAALAGRVYQSRRPAATNGADDARRMGPMADAALFAGAPSACHPLSAQAQTVGVLAVTQRRGSGVFQPHELDCLEQTAHIAASAIINLVTQKSRDDARDAVVGALGTLAEYRDDNTGQHVLRVTQFSLLLAETLRKTDEFKARIDDQFLSDLIRAVPLHDIGKVGIPDRILLKNRKLTREEMTIMKRHVDIGLDTIESVRKRVPCAGYLEMARDIVAGHHEWYNGCGYPTGLKADRIPLAARIVALADVYDALTTERPYKSAYRHEDAVQIICDSSALQFDPAVVAAFRKQETQFATLADALSDQRARRYAESVSDATPEGNAANESSGLYELAPLD